MRTGSDFFPAFVALAGLSLAGLSSPALGEDIVGSLDPAITARMAEQLRPVGSKLPESVSVYDKTQTLVPFGEIFDAQYTVLMTGCLTCPVFAGDLPGLRSDLRGLP